MHLHTTPFRPADHGPVFAELLAEPRLPPLDAGSPNHAVYPRLKALDLASAFAPHQILDEDMAKACLAGLWLYHDFLEESHVLSQDIDTPTGSYWHGLLHRREPDFENARYWFRRVGSHPVFEPLQVAAVELSCSNSPFLAIGFAKFPAWDAFAFIDLCEAALSGGTDYTLLCQKIQQREWELLFGYSYRAAIGAPPLI